MEHETKQKQLLLPISVVTKVDVGRLLREASAVDDFLDQAAIRQPGTPLKLPKTTHVLDEIVEQNKLNMLVEEERKKLVSFLTELREHAPQLHMSFSADPSPAFLQKITTYLRENIHPYALLQVGLQPTIGAGFMLRTTNKYYDFSVRTALKAKHDILMQALGAMKTQSEPASVKEPVS